MAIPLQAVQPSPRVFQNVKADFTNLRFGDELDVAMGIACVFSVGRRKEKYNKLSSFLKCSRVMSVFLLFRNIGGWTSFVDEKAERNIKIELKLYNYSPCKLEW